MRKYENLDFIHDNTLPPRAHYIPYDSMEKALAGNKSQSAFYTLLNGEWEFKYIYKYAQRGKNGNVRKHG